MARHSNFICEDQSSLRLAYLVLDAEFFALWSIFGSVWSAWLDELENSSVQIRPQKFDKGLILKALDYKSYSLWFISLSQLIFLKPNFCLIIIS